MSDTAAFIFGIVGGAFAELVGLYKLRQKPNLPLFLRSWFYWLMTILMILAGGGLAVIYNRTHALNEMLAANIGASAPLILRALSSKPPTPGSSD